MVSEEKMMVLGLLYNKPCSVILLDVLFQVLTRMLRSMEMIWGVPALHCFDWIAGTSTGAIFALAMASGKSVTECQALYMRLKDKVTALKDFRAW